MSKTKLGKMPTAEVLGWPGRPLQARQRRAVIDAIIAGDDAEKGELIVRLITSLGMTPLSFAELSLELLENGSGIRSTKYRRIDERKQA